MIMGRRRWVWDTQVPTVRRTTWASRWLSTGPSARVRRSASSTSSTTGANTAGSSEKPRDDRWTGATTLPVAGSTTTVRATKPSSPRIRRACNDSSPTSPTASPST